MNYVRHDDGVIAYTGSNPEDDNWYARFIEAENYDGGTPIDQLPLLGDSGTPWEPKPPTPEEIQAEAEAVVLQHMVKEKVAELQWDSSTQYHVGDVVYHNGSMWRATSNNSNNEPDDVPGDWEKVS